MTKVDEVDKTKSTQGGEGELAISQDPGGSLADEQQIDPQEYARLLSLYESSFRNIAEGTVLKGTVLKVTASEVVVDVGYKSEGIISVTEFLDEQAMSRSSRATRWTCCSNGPRIATATSFSRARRPRR